MAKRLFIFNPDCELAIANGSRYYMPPANIVQMAADLAYLAAYLAADGDYVLMPELPESGFVELREKISGYVCRPVTWKELESLEIKGVEPWGWSPKICHELAEIHLSQEWTGDKKEGYSRKKAMETLKQLVEACPFVEQGVIPRICYSIEEIEQNLSEGSYIVKAPWSSSGRGLQFIENRVTPKEKEWLSGMFRRQGYMMLEQRLDKVYDFAMEFCSREGQVEFIGLSAFQTGENGEYRGNYIGSQEAIEDQLYEYVGETVMREVREQLIHLLPGVLPSEYSGYLGVDMMIYRDARNEYRIQPCVEINLRYNMGIVALFFSRRCLSKQVRGDFAIHFYPQPGEALREHLKKQLEKPLVCENNRITKGYLNLTPVGESTCFVATVEVG